MTSASPPREGKSILQRPFLLLFKQISFLNYFSKPGPFIKLARSLRQPNRDSRHLDRTTMSGALNGLEFDPHRSWLAETSQHSDQGSVSISFSVQPDEMASSSFPTKTLVIVYIVGFVLAAWIILASIYDKETKTYKWDKPWVPAITRRDAAAMPFFPMFLLLPAILWPLLVAGFILTGIVLGLGVTLGSATSCCGIPLSGKKEAEAGGGNDSDTTRDLELGAVADVENGGVPGDGGEEEVGSDQASVRSAASAESERPPPYASVAPEEDGEGETDGLLRKGATMGTAV